MGSSPCCSKVGLRKGPWSTKEDALLSDYILRHGEGRWRALPKNAGLLRCGKSCRLRWMNYLRPGIKRGNIDRDEEDLIVRMHALLGNRWSLIAGRLPGRTDNEIKNYWNTHLLKKLRNDTHKELPENPPKKKERKHRKKNGAGPPVAKTHTNGEDKVKVYIPKPIRVSTGFCGRTESHETPTSGEAGKVDWPFLLYGGNEDDFLGGSCVPPPQDSASGEGDMLELVYDEYLQLL